MQRLRRLAPGLIGLALAAVVLWRGAATLEREAESREAFALRVSEPAAVHELGEPAETMQWRGWVTPVEERERVELRIDGRVHEFGGDADAGELILPLDSLREQPGWHFVELSLERRGGRGERIVDPILIGEFARDVTQQKSCALVLTVSPTLLDDLLRSLLERELLPILRDNEHMGPDTELHEAKLALRDDGLTFELELRGVNTLAVAGAIIVRVLDDRRLQAELAILTEVDFRGELRNKARGIGAAGGAAIGGLITGPLAPVGAAAGWFAADVVVTKKARELIREQIDAGLEQLDDIELLPSHVELIHGRPASRVGIGFCEQTRVRATGISAGLWVVPDPAADPSGGGEQFDLGVPGPLITAATPTTEPLEQAEDVRVELSIDAVNNLLTSWTQSGLLAELIGEKRALERANAELEAWTPLQLGQLRPTRPPTLTPVGGPSDGWRYGIGGLAINMTGVDDQPWGQVYIAAAGDLSPHWDAEAGALSLAGSLDTLAITCAKPAPEVESPASPVLHGCFSEVLEAAEVRERIDAHLRPGARGLPSLTIGALLAEAVELRIDALTLNRPRPGVLRLSAKLQPTSE
ncbi:MAG TPA: hypothetical protein VK034_17425 [Enhygromyxa sp.]|nr:hypothetical protein [Enhygromyxa sp.]